MSRGRPPGGRAGGEAAAGPDRRLSLPVWFVSLALLAAALIAPPPVRAAATPQAAFWMTDGSVYATAVVGQTLYLGGSFSYVGPDTGAGTQLDIVTATPSSFPLIDGQVHAAVPDGGGGWYVGGTFTRVGTATRNNLVHIVPAQAGTGFAVDSGFNPDVNGDVTALALGGGTLYAGGAFTSVNGTTRSHLAALNATNGAVASAWDPAPDAGVDVLVLSGNGSTLYVGGAFNATGGSPSIGGADRNYIAALNADVSTAGAAISPWDPNADGEVKALALSGDGATLYAGGAFTNIGGQPRGHVAALNADVTTAGGATGWAADTNGDVNALVLSDDGKLIYLGGAFHAAAGGTSVGGKARQYLARVDTATAVVDDTWNPPTNGVVYSVDLVNNGLAVGGAFTTVTGTPRRHLAQVNTTSGQLASWDPGAQDVVRVVKAAVLAGSTTVLFVGGDFTSTGGATRNNLAALNIVSFQPLDWDPNVDGLVRTLAVTSGTVFVGGDFHSVGGAARNYFAAVDVSTGQPLPAWSMSVNDKVYSLLIGGSTLYAGGAFTVIGTASRARLAAFDTSSAALSTWAPTVDDGAVLSMALSKDSPPVLYAGGSFTSVNGATRDRLAALDTTSGDLTSWDPAVTGNSVMAVALSTDSPPVLYAGGDFTMVGVTPRHDIAAISTSNGSLISWAADDADGPVHTLALAGDNVLLYAGGEFTAIGGQSSHPGVAALTTPDGNATSWTPVPGAGSSSSYTVRSLELAPDHGTLYVGGDFKTISGEPRSGLAVFQPPVSQADPTAGAYNKAQSVALSCTDKTDASCTANILYSTDGSLPTTPYAAGVNIPVDTLNTSTTLKFYATDSEGMREVINSYSYIIDTQPPTVSASPPGGTFTDVQNITLTCKDTGGAGCLNIYYTTDGSVPTTGSAKYSSAVSLDKDTVLKFFAEDAAHNHSSIQQQSYTIDATAPTTTPSPAPGTYSTPQQVTLSCDDKGGFGCAVTYYTVDGTIPNTSSPRYSQPITIDSNTTLNYFSVDKAGHRESPTTGVYLIQTGTIVTSGGGLFGPPRFLLGAWLLLAVRLAYLRRARRRAL